MNNQLTQKTDESKVSLSLEEFVRIIDACDEIVVEKMSRSSNACIDFAEQIINRQDENVISIFDQKYDAPNNLYTYSNRLTVHCNPFEPYKGNLISQKWHLLFSLLAIIIDVENKNINEIVIRDNDLLIYGKKFFKRCSCKPMIKQAKIALEMYNSHLTSDK